jgi:hypothetical protein
MTMNRIRFRVRVNVSVIVMVMVGVVPMVMSGLWLFVRNLHLFICFVISSELNLSEIQNSAKVCVVTESLRFQAMHSKHVHLKLRFLLCPTLTLLDNRLTL